MSWSDAIKSVAESVSFVAAALAAVFAAVDFRKKVRLERARWMRDLYEKFYERVDLKAIRDKLDDGDAAEIEELVKHEDSGFTDYLNFFEFLAFLWKSGQIKEQEVLDLFDYYLKNLRYQRTVWEYIENPARGFERLHVLLNRIYSK